jgi:hypothetical protein
VSGPSRALRWALWTLIVIVVLVVLFTVVFPWIESNLSNPTMGHAAPGRPVAMTVMMP